MSKTLTSRPDVWFPTAGDRCVPILQLADANRTILDKTPAGIEHKYIQDAYFTSMQEALHCLQPKCGFDFKQDNIQKMLDAKKTIETMMYRLESLENKGMPIYDAQVLKEVRQGIDRLYVQALRKCTPRFFISTIGPMIANLEKTSNGLLELNSKWLAFKQDDDPIARYLIPANGYTTDDLNAAKLMILMGAPLKDLEKLFPKKAE